MSVEAITWALRVKTGSSITKAILLVLANHANPKGVCWPSFADVARQAECSFSTVQRAVREMESAGLLERQRRRREDGNYGTYTIALSLSADLTVSTYEDHDQTPASRETRPVTVTSGQPDHRSDCPKPPVSLPEQNRHKNHHTVVVEDARAADRETSDWPSRLREAQQRAGSALNLTASGVHHFADLRRLCEPTSGHPCDWERHVLPAIDELAASFTAKGQQFRSWAIIGPSSIRNRDRDLAGLPEPVTLEPPHVQHQPARKRGTSLSDSLVDYANEYAAAVQRREAGIV